MCGVMLPLVDSRMEACIATPAFGDDRRLAGVSRAMTGGDVLLYAAVAVYMRVKADRSSLVKSCGPGR